MPDKAKGKDEATKENAKKPAISDESSFELRGWTTGIFSDGRVTATAGEIRKKGYDPEEMLRQTLLKPVETSAQAPAASAPVTATSATAPSGAAGSGTEPKTSDTEKESGSDGDHSDDFKAGLEDARAGKPPTPKDREKEAAADYHRGFESHARSQGHGRPKK